MFIRCFFLQTKDFTDITNALATNLFAQHEKLSAKEIFTYLRENGIFVRYFNKPRIDNFLRITIGTDEEMDLILEKLSEICK